MFRSVLFIFVSLQLTQCWSARILSIFPMPSYSHHILGEAILKELASKGHDVTFISSYESKHELPNYRNIYVKEASNLMKDRKVGFTTFSMPAAIITFFIHEISLRMSRLIYDDEGVQSLLKSEEEFDLILMEHFFDEPLFGFAHRFKAPVVLLSTGGPNAYNNRIMGNPSPPSYIPHTILDYTPQMTLWQRLHNFIFTIYTEFVFYVLYMPRYNNLLHEYFPDAPRLQELLDNTSLILLNSHPAVSPPVPLVPNMIEIGGFHIAPAQNMSKDLRSFLDEADEGVIYFSMGSNLKSRDMEPEMVQEILKAFSGLKMKVLWKFEDDELPGKPDNVRIEKWIPQTAVLGHRNTKLFLTHGGRLSTVEAIYFGVPIIGIPIFADQYTNIAHAVFSNYGLAVPFHSLNSKTLSDAIRLILSDPKYVEEVKYRSSAMRSSKFTALETAVQWTEYVIKHKGAHHLKNASLQLSWYQYILLDVILVSLIGCAVAGCAFFMLVKCLCRRCKTQQKKVKNN